MKAIDGTDLSLDDYRGKVVLLVNVAVRRANDELARGPRTVAYQ
jgi:glutathione peroxidase-family protein